jgi:hypothetical protein
MRTATGLLFTPHIRNIDDKPELWFWRECPVSGERRLLSWEGNPRLQAFLTRQMRERTLARLQECWMARLAVGFWHWLCGK